MIKDENGYPAEHLEIEVELRDRMLLHIQNSIIRNLETIKKFLEIPDSEDICAGLYTYAVEEYGKILYLKNLSPPHGSKTINLQYKRSFLNHHVKFPLALKELSDACKILNTGGFLDSGFLPSGFIIDLIADFEARKEIFFADFTQDQKSIEMPPKVDRGLLVKAVEDFLSHMKNQVF